MNGGWLRKSEIPSDASGWGAFQELHERSRDGLHEILEHASQSYAAAGTDQRKVGDVYASYMDTAAIETHGITPLVAQLRAIARFTSASQLPATFAHCARIGVQNPLAVNVGQDPKRSTVNVVLVNQSGLGLPDRDYYLKQDPKMSATRAAYAAYITRLLDLAKQPDPAGAASRIIALETAIATPQWDRARSRDRNLTYNKMTVAELAALSPAYSWSAYLGAAGLSRATDVIVRQPDYIRALDPILASTPVSTWREYLTFKLLDATADELPAAFEQAKFEFRGRTLAGQQEMAVSWKRAVDGVEGIPVSRSASCTSRGTSSPKRRPAWMRS